MHPIAIWLHQVGWQTPDDINWQLEPRPAHLVMCPTCKAPSFTPCYECISAIHFHAKRNLAIEVVVTIMLITGPP
jgi:hypothetical protein